MKKQISMLAVVIIIAGMSCNKDIEIKNNTNMSATNNEALAKQIDEKVKNFKNTFLKGKGSFVDEGITLPAAEAIELIETDLNYTYAETWVEQNVVNTPFRYSFDLDFDPDDNLTADEIYSIYHTALNAIITTNNELTNADKKLTWVDLEMVVGDDGGIAVDVNYLFGLIKAPIGPDPEITFNFNYFWHWNAGGTNTGLGQFYSLSGTPSPVNNQYFGAVSRINHAAQNNYNGLLWNWQLQGYYIHNITQQEVNRPSNPLYHTNPQMIQWQTLNGGQVNTWANNQALVFPEATYRCAFPVSPFNQSAPPNGYWWNTDGTNECLPDYAMNFYTDRIVDMAANVVPTTGLLTTNQSVYSFDVSGVHLTLGGPVSNNKILYHGVNLNIGTFIFSRNTLPSNLPITLTNP